MLTENELVNLPVLQVLLQHKRAHVGVQVENPGAVDVLDKLEIIKYFLKTLIKHVGNYMCPASIRTVYAQ